MIEEMASDESGASLSGEIDASAGDALQLIAFALGEQFYCVDIMAVREIRAWTGTTTLPNAAHFVRGVINLRGAIVPIIDLRIRFALGETDPTKNHVVVIVEIGDKLTGLLVDAVSDILIVREGDVAPIPETDGEGQNLYLDGLITQENGMVALIALDRLVVQASLH